MHTIWNQKKGDLSSDLVSVLKDIAKTGGTRYDWHTIAALAVIQLQLIIDDYELSSGKPPDIDGETFAERYQRVRNGLLSFLRAPFTMQRICELLTEPRRYYRTTSKFFLAFSKLVCGISGNMYDDEKDIGSSSNAFFGPFGATPPVTTSASVTGTAPLLNLSKDPKSPLLVPMTDEEDVTQATTTTSMEITE